MQIYVRYLRLRAQTVGVNDMASTPMHLRDATACLIAMTATRWVRGEVNMVDTLKPDSGQSPIKLTCVISYRLKLILNVDF